MNNSPQQHFKKRFQKSATAAIEACTDEVLEMLFDGDLPVGATWHPNGFVVFRLGKLGDFAAEHPDIDTRWLTPENADNMLRLHVWPRDRREYYPDHPRTHCHSFLLTSKIMAGQYADDIIKTSVEPGTRNVPAKVKQRGFDPDPYDVLRVEYTNPDLAEFVPSGERLHVVGASTRSRLPGTFHHMDTQVFHTTQIPDDDFCMTLLVTSAERFGEDRMINDLGIVTPFASRVPVNDLDVARIVRQAGLEMRGEIGLREFL